MPEHTTTTIDFDRLDPVIREIERTLGHIADQQADAGGTFTLRIADGRDVDNDKQARSAKASIARDLLRASELAGLLRAELHTAYWQLKGHPDPRHDTDTPPSPHAPAR